MLSRDGHPDRLVWLERVPVPADLATGGELLYFRAHRLASG